MSTIGLSSWAVDLKDIAAVYPFQGSEVALVIAAYVFWIGWHLLQIRQESREFADIEAAHPVTASGATGVDRY